MPSLNRTPNAKELEKLVSIYLRAETAIINEIGRLRSQGLVDYHAVAALERVQAILRQMESDCWEYVPKMIEKQFYVRVPEARKALEVPETAAKHAAGYANAAVLTGEQHAIVDRLAANLMGEITDASMTVMATLQSALIGRVEPDVYRRVGLEQVAAQQAAGRGVNASVPAFVQALRREGVRAFTDKAGRDWSLHTYCTMVSRTTSRQAEVLAVLTADSEHDLYMISSHGTTCALCAPYEGRVYSRSGTDPDFPPLAAAFGKVDPAGPDTLANTWLNIHPNCLHVLLPWTAAGRTDEEISLVCRTESVPQDTAAREDGWRAFRIQGELDFSLIGILAGISAVLAENRIGIFVVSTYNTDYVLTKADDFERALGLLESRGYGIAR